ncbi:MAG: DegT/DnrJ/EryC1/StrS family aminotransferase [Gammaproteobacteria bacterium]|nr:DegT/DnrJ/EryC1/StrS family aminotransferase [Gammaproteobacteria bacterium]
MTNKPIYVTQPFLPPLEEFESYLREIWDSKILSNSGYFHQQLENALCEYLGVEYISLFSNGTIALITALQALQIKGEVITTPYSFVATAHSIMWNGLKPIFVDVDSETLNLDPARIEAAISSQTTAIMPVHCYGRACDVNAIQQIADKYNLKVIYDAAHAFGVKDDDGSLLRHGDLSVLSFHATKVFNTFEGGAIVCPDVKTKQRIDQLKNFGFQDDVTVIDFGINGKMSEINAAFGVLQLKYIDQAVARRRNIDALYRELLKNVKGIRCMPEVDVGMANYSYFPIFVESEYPVSRDELFQKLKDNDIYSRRYFYPLISDYEIYREFSSGYDFSVALNAANKILCLPIYPDLSAQDVKFVINIINS